MPIIASQAPTRDGPARPVSPSLLAGLLIHPASRAGLPLDRVAELVREPVESVRMAVVRDPQLFRLDDKDRVSHAFWWLRKSGNRQLTVTDAQVRAPGTAGPGRATPPVVVTARHRVGGPCLTCGNTFLTTRSDALYCPDNPNCRKRAQRKRDRVCARCGEPLLPRLRTYCKRCRRLAMHDPRPLSRRNAS